MKSLFNKYVIIFALIIFFLIGSQFYFLANSFQRDVNTYLKVIQGEAILTTATEKKVLFAGEEKYKLFSGDVVATSKDSLGVIEWGDKSVTRLAQNSKIKIMENFVGDDLGKIQISFEILKGKTWSNVISMFIGDSYFHQEMKGNVASVRGTVFEMSYDDEYLITHKHKVEVTSKAGEIKEVVPGGIFNIKTFSFDAIGIFIDETFQKLNKALDEKYLEELRRDFFIQLKENNPFNLVARFSQESQLTDIFLGENPLDEFRKFYEKIPDEKKEQVLGTLSSLTQSLNFENGGDEQLYFLKLFLKQSIIEKSQDEEYKKNLVKHSLYDLTDGEIGNNLLSQTANFLGENQILINISEAKDMGLQIIDDVFLLNGQEITLESFNETMKKIGSLSEEKIHGLLDNALYFIKNMLNK